MRDIDRLDAELDPAHTLESAGIETVDDEPSILELLTIIGRWKWFIARCAICLAVIAGIVSFLLPNKYTATATIMPPQQGSSMSAALMSQLGSLGSLASLAGGSAGGSLLKNPNDLYVALLKSRSVEDAMVQRFALNKYYRVKHTSSARKALESNCKIESGTKDSLIRISVKDKDPAHAAAMANGYIEEYKKFSANLAIGEASQRRLFFEQQLLQAKDNLAKAEEDFKLTQQKTGLIQFDSQARALIETVASLRAQISAREVQIQTMSAFSTSNNPELLLAQQQLSALKGQLRQLGGNETQDSDLIVPKGKVTEAGLEYVRKYRDVKYYDTIFELLARQLEMAKLDEAKQGSVVQIVDYAVQPDIKSSPPRSLIVLGGFLIGVIGAIVWALFRESLASLNGVPERADRLRMLRSAWGKGY